MEQEVQGWTRFVVARLADQGIKDSNLAGEKPMEFRLYQGRRYPGWLYKPVYHGLYRFIRESEQNPGCEIH